MAKNLKLKIKNTQIADAFKVKPSLKKAATKTTAKKKTIKEPSVKPKVRIVKKVEPAAPIEETPPSIPEVKQAVELPHIEKVIEKPKDLASSGRKDGLVTVVEPKKEAIKPKEEPKAKDSKATTTEKPVEKKKPLDTKPAKNRLLLKILKISKKIVKNPLLQKDLTPETNRV